MLRVLVTAALFVLCIIISLNASAATRLTDYARETTRCLTKVNFTVKNDYKVDLVTFKRVSGVGPDEITFGNHEPICTKTVEVMMTPGTKYELVMDSFKVNNKSCGTEVRKQEDDNQSWLEFSDDYGQSYKGLVIKSTQVHFEYDKVYGFKLSFSASCECNTDNDCTGELPLVDKGWTPSSILKRCEGDCWKDSDCEPGLYCFHTHGLTNIPGCALDNYIDLYDYCVPIDPTAAKQICSDHQCINPPTAHPTKRPTFNPTKRPTPHPTKRPTPHPTKRPTFNPTKRPTLPPTAAPTTCLTKVTFTVKNNYNFDEVTFKRTGGFGPDEIKFGPNHKRHCTETVEVEMAPGTTYELKCYSVNKKYGVGEVRLNGDQLEFRDNDGGSSYNGLIITSNKCFFTSSHKFVLNSSYSCTPQKPSTPICHDDYDECPDWAFHGLCEDAEHADFLKKYCEKSCAVTNCREYCHDKDADCPDWVSIGACQDAEFRDFMMRNCKKTCAFCDGPSARKNSNIILNRKHILKELRIAKRNQDEKKLRMTSSRFSPRKNIAKTNQNGKKPGVRFSRRENIVKTNQK